MNFISAHLFRQAEHCSVISSFFDSSGWVVNGRSIFGGPPTQQRFFRRARGAAIAEDGGQGEQAGLDRAVSRALLILETLARAKDPVRMSALASDLELQKSTVHRILRTLAEMDYVSQEAETGRYRASLKTWELGSAIIGEHPVKRAAAPFLQDLNRLTGETVSLTVMAGDDVLYLDKIVSPRPMRFTTRPGSRIAAPLTAGGRAMLAHEPGAREIVERVAARRPSAPDVDVEALLAELDEVRTRGYATSTLNPGVVSVAGAIMGHDGRAAAALSVSAPTDRLNANKQAKTIEAVLTTCANMAEIVGRL